MTPAASTPSQARFRALRPGRLWSSRLLGTDGVVKAMVLLLPLIRLLMVLPGNPSIFPDGRTYRTQNTWLDFSLTSLDGVSVRPWGVTAWMALWPSDRAIMLAQALLSAVAWGTFALVIAAGIANLLVRRLFVLAIVLLACSAQLANWDGVIQGDSVPMSTGLLALAALIVLLREPRWGRAGVFAAAALWYTMTRPNLFVVLLAWATALVVIGLLRRRLLVLGVTAVLLIGFSGYSYTYNMRSDVAWEDHIGASRTTIGMAYPLGKYDPVADAVLRDLRTSDAPKCMLPRSPAAVTHNGTTSWVLRTVAACPEMDVWATENWQRWWIGWLLEHPRGAARIIATKFPETLSPSVKGNVIAATPNSVSALVVGTQGLPQDQTPNATYKTQPMIFWFLAAFVLALMARSRRLWRGTTRDIDLALLATVLGGLACAVSSILLIQTMPTQSGQESLGATAVIVASLVAAVGLGWDRLLGRPAHVETDRTRESDPPA